MTVPAMHLAQLNVAHLLAPIDSPPLVDFVARLDEINTLAENSPGYVWRYDGDPSAGETGLPGDPDTLYNLSVWEGTDPLFAFVYRSAHKELMTRRRDWFAPPVAMHMVLWWVPAGHQPDIAEALARLQQLQAHGPGPHAFGFRKAYDARGCRIESRAAVRARNAETT